MHKKYIFILKDAVALLTCVEQNHSVNSKKPRTFSPQVVNRHARDFLNVLTIKVLLDFFFSAHMILVSTPVFHAQAASVDHHNLILFCCLLGNHRVRLLVYLLVRRHDRCSLRVRVHASNLFYIRGISQFSNRFFDNNANLFLLRWAKCRIFNFLFSFFFRGSTSLQCEVCCL